MAYIKKIPLALQSTKYGGIFWNVLLSVICPATLVGPYSAALLAALSIRLRLKPLMLLADVQMTRHHAIWSNINFAGIWNLECLSLILDADTSFEERRGTGDFHSSLTPHHFLSTDDRGLFQRLVDYGRLVANMSTTLDVQYRPFPSWEIRTVKTTPRRLVIENGITWLLRNTDNKIPQSICLINPSL
jgi:hypothetical protein